MRWRVRCPVAAAAVPPKQLTHAATMEREGRLERLSADERVLRHAVASARRLALGGAGRSVRRLVMGGAAARGELASGLRSVQGRGITCRAWDGTGRR